MKAAAPPTDAPVFWTLRRGLSSLVDAVAADLDRLAVKVETERAVQSLDELDGDRVVLATPAFETARLLRPSAPIAAEMATMVDYSSVALVTLTLPGDAFGTTFAGSGFLVPRREGRLLTACTVLTSKWGHLDTKDDVVVRLSAGKRGDERAMTLDDDELVRRLRVELALATGVRSEPTSVRVVRWPKSFPQYDVGHVDRVTRLRSRLPRNVVVAGAAFDGVGIPACIASGNRAAALLLS